jgi:hypothetical protein
VPHAEVCFFGSLFCVLLVEACWALRLD